MTLKDDMTVCENVDHAMIYKYAKDRLSLVAGEFGKVTYELVLMIH